MVSEGNVTDNSGASSDNSSSLYSYDLYIAGKDVEGDGWVYTASAKSLLEDVFTSISLKRALEKDPDAAEAAHPYVVGRCAIAGDAQIDMAIESASAAVALWAAVPLERRMRLGDMFREQL